MYDGCCPPLCREFFVRRLPPCPGGLLWASRPFHLYCLGRSQFRFRASANVFHPLHSAQNGIQHDVQQAIPVQIGNVERCVTPLGFRGALNAAVRSRHDSKEFSFGLKPGWCGPFRLCDPNATQVLEKLNVSGCVPRDDVDIAITIPVDAARRGECSTLQRIGLLLKVSRWCKVEWQTRL